MKLPPFRAIARAYLMSVFCWCGFALLMGLQYSPFNRENPRAWLANLLLGAALRGSVLAFWTPPIFYLVGKYLGSSRSRMRYALLWSLGAVPFVLLYTTILWVLIPASDVQRSFHLLADMVRTSFADEIFTYVAIVVAAHAYEYFRRMRLEERERYEYQEALATSELQALKMQLQPHFLFNTLNGITALVESDPQKAVAMILKLSNLLRASLERGSADLIPLKDELKFVSEYLELEKMRFGSRLEISWVVVPETHALLVPQMILQPLVENAIRHGIGSSRESGWIEIGANQANGSLAIRLRNTAGGRHSNGTGVGMRNAEARLKYLYSGDASLRFAISEDRTATVDLILPALNSQPAKEQSGADPKAFEKEIGHARSHSG
jgi:two-component system, LytTR family, sensor kinase